MKFDVLNRWTGAVQFTAEIDCPDDADRSIKLGLAVRWALKNGARLDGARLDGASLDGASLDGASLDGARLDGARLDGASLVGASLDGASLVGASLDGARLDGASLVGARLVGARLVGAKNVPDWTMPDGLKFSQYLKEVVPALLTAGGKTVREIVGGRAWDCHNWDNCPMAHAFGVNKLEDVPPLYRARAKEFVQLFDARMIPEPEIDQEPAPIAAA